MIGSILALSIIAIAPEFVQGPPAPSPQTQNIITAAARFCGANFSTDMELQACMSLQEQSYNAIRELFIAYEGMGVDLAPAIVFCVEDRFVGPDMINLVAIEACIDEILGTQSVNHAQ